jgi:hypothetical protein
VTDDFHYYFIAPAEDARLYSEIQKLVSDFMTKMGETASQNLMKSSEGTYESVKWSYFQHRPDLSHNPEKPRLEPEEVQYWYLIFDYIIPGKEAEYESTLKKIISLSKSMNSEVILNTFEGNIGADIPEYVLSFSGKSPGEFWSNYEKELNRAGAEIPKLIQQLIKQTRKRDFKSEYARPDLSYTPKK